MTNSKLADGGQALTGSHGHPTRATVAKIFVIIAAAGVLLRIFYAGHLYEDDGLWFAAGEEVLRGKALYRQIYFDKPPGLPLTYALLFCLFGAHVLVIRLFTIFYSFAISAVLYLFGSRLYDRRAGLLAAAMFAVFSTTYSIGHVQSLNTDFLMVLPYTAAAYLMILSVEESGDSGKWAGWFAVSAGTLTGIAFQINPKGLFDLVFFAVFLIAARRWTTGRELRDQSHAEDVSGRPRRAVRVPLLLLMSGGGFVLGSMPFVAYIAATGSASAYLQYVWRWGALYAGSYPARTVVWSALRFTAGYFALNDILLITLAFVAVETITQMRRRAATRLAPLDGSVEFDTYRRYRSDAALLMWFAVSYAGVALGGRFYSHYFLQILPALCLIGGRGLDGILASLRTQRPALRRAVIGVLAVGFAFTLVRFHGRSLLITLDWVSNEKSKSSIGWYHDVRNREEREVAGIVTDSNDGDEAPARRALEGIRSGGPRTRAAEGPGDYLFVWGYRPEIYFWSGLLPASRFLSSQPLTGVPADVHYFGDDYRSLLDEATTAAARAELARDLEETKPKYIVDEIGFFNPDLAILKYADLGEIMDRYKALGGTGRFLIYVRKDLTRKGILHSSPAWR